MERNGGGYREVVKSGREVGESGEKWERLGEGGENGRKVDDGGREVEMKWGRRRTGWERSGR